MNKKEEARLAAIYFYRKEIAAALEEEKLKSSDSSYHVQVIAYHLGRKEVLEQMLDIFERLSK